jgi:serine phosphatase RsbU (regulator of sigma subunit)
VTPIPPGALLCLYTDGLVERRDQSLDAGIGRLADVVGQLTATNGEALGSQPPAEAACARVMRALVGNAPAADDVAVVVLHRDALPMAGAAAAQA